MTYDPYHHAHELNINIRWTDIPTESQWDRNKRLITLKPGMNRNQERYALALSIVLAENNAPHDYLLRYPLLVADAQKIATARLTPRHDLNHDCASQARKPRKQLDPKRTYLSTMKATMTALLYTSQKSDSDDTSRYPSPRLTKT
jgi:hypothetical protein